MDGDGGDPAKENLGVRILILFYLILSCHIPGPSRPRRSSSAGPKSFALALFRRRC